MLADHLHGKVIQNINSTAVGGGVAEILTRMIPLLKQLGVEARWDVIKGNERFFITTKKFHNGLHGVPVQVSDEEYESFLEVNRQNADEMSFGDIVFVHDPQPIALVERRQSVGGNWVWRCHIDLAEVYRISGRDHGTLNEWFGRLDATLVAEHGSWIRERGSVWRMFRQQTREWKSQILPILQLYADRLPGAMVEEKDYAVAWHYRLADPEHAQRLASELFDHLVSFTANIEIQVLRGHKVIEVKPAGITKGTAAQYLIEREKPDFILSIGDDATDEDLFNVLPPWAYSIRVGIANTRARFNLKNTREVLRLLDMLAKSLPGILANSTTEGG